MFKFVNKRLRNRKGFTLIELVVVVAILGILALIAIPRFANIREDAQVKAAESTAISILNAAELYYVQESGDPTGNNASTLIDAGLLREDIQGTVTIGYGTTTGSYIVTYTAIDGNTTVTVP